MTRLFALFTAAAVLTFCMAQMVRAQEPLPSWVTIVPAQDCSQGCWRLVSAEYLDEQESQGLHHIFTKTLDAAGNQIVDRFTVAWADGSVTIPTKPPPDWSDSAMWDCFNANQGEVGGYRAFAGVWEANSDVASGLGLPYCAHVSYRLVWGWDNGGGSTPTPTPAPTATPTPTPPPPLPYRVGLPLVSKG